MYRHDPGVDAWKLLCCDSDGLARGDEYGNSLALSEDGQIVAIGATQTKTTHANSYGYVRVFRYITNEDRWVQLGSTLHGLAVGDRFGASVSLSSDGCTLAVGAPLAYEGCGSLPYSDSMETTGKLLASSATAMVNLVVVLLLRQMAIY